MPIKTTKPLVVPATDKATYDTVWMKELHLMSSSVGANVTARVKLLLYKGEGEVSTTAEPITFKISDIFNQAEYDVDQLSVLLPLLASATREQKIGLLASSLLDFVEDEAKLQDLI